MAVKTTGEAKPVSIFSGASVPKVALPRIPRRRGLSLISVASFLVLWHLVATGIASPYFPTPLAVARAGIAAFFERDFLGFTVQQHIVSSLGRILFGFGLAALLAIPLGLASGWLRSIEHLTGPVVELIRPIPPLAWIPFAIYFFGDPFDAVFIVFLAAFFPILLSTLAGVKAIDPILIDAARTLGAKRLPLFLKVVVPAALGHIVTGMRIGLGVGWMCIMAAEMVGVKGGGLGVYIWSMGEVGRFDAVFAGMALIGLVGLALTGTMGVVQKKIAGESRGVGGD
jgi:ABC-type nitrate/sulfonate/bicarbonate transport system permease component